MMRADVSAFASAREGRQSARVLFVGGDGAHGVGSAAAHAVLLGELNGSAQSRWLKTIEVFNEQGESRQLKLFPSEVAPPEDDEQVAQVLVDGVRLERTRRFGGPGAVAAIGTGSLLRVGAGPARR